MAKKKNESTKEKLQKELSKCFDANTFRGDNLKNLKKIAEEECMGEILEKFGDDKITIGEFQELVNDLNKAIIEGQGLEFPNTKNSSDVLFKKVSKELDSPLKDLEKITNEYILPFLNDGSDNGSLTMSVGPGSEIGQYFPHDIEYINRVFYKYSKNVILIIEGLEELGFGDEFGEMMNTPVDDLESNIFFNELKKHIQQSIFRRNLEKMLFKDIDPVVEKPTSKSLILQYNDKKNSFLFVLLGHDYIKRAIDPQIERIIKYTQKNVLLCGIRTKDCADLFFKESNVYFKNFDWYSFLHGHYTPLMGIKNISTSFLVNVKQMRENNFSKENLYDGLTLKLDDSEAMGYGKARLCMKGLRPLNRKKNPYCKQGLEKGFWNGLGGKRKTKKMYRKRMTKKSRKLLK